MFHGVALVALVVLPGIGMFMVKVERTPGINWEYQQPRLVSETQFRPPPVQEQPSFPFGQLGPTAQPNLEPWRPPTPPTENADAMDWTPSHSLQPRRPQPRVAGPSPFFGKLPALGGGLRPQTQPKQSLGIPPGFFDKREPLAFKPEASQPALAEPKFFPGSIDTGLEKMFGQIFSLGDMQSRDTAPTSVRHDAGFVQTPQRSGGAFDEEPHSGPAPAPSVLALFSVAMLFMILLVWMVSGHLLIAVPKLRCYILCLAAAFPAIRIFVTSPVPVIILLGQIVAACLLAVTVSSPAVQNDAYIKLASGLLAFLIAQEVFIFSQRGLASTEVLARPIEATRFQSSDQRHGQDVHEAASYSGQLDRAYSPQRRAAPFPVRTTFESPVRKSSAETMYSQFSVADSTSSRSTAPDWRTPRPSRMQTRESISSAGFGLGGLRL
jgi:hypothetical protein